MNKQELIDYCNVLKENKSRFINCIDVDRIIDTIKQLDEPEKVKVPQCVADWITHSKNIGRSLFGAMSIFEELKKLMSYFPDSFINRQLELILIPKTNTYFSLRDCLTKNDVTSKVLMWCTRDISKARPYQQQKRNIDFYVDNRTRL